MKKVIFALIFILVGVYIANADEVKQEVKPTQSVLSILKTFWVDTAPTRVAIAEGTVALVEKSKPVLKSGLETASTALNNQAGKIKTE